MKYPNLISFTICILHLIPGRWSSPTLQRSALAYGSKISMPKQVEHTTLYEVSDAGSPASEQLGTNPSQTNFYDPSYGFSPESIAAVMTHDKGIKSGEPVLSAVLLNSKDYYKLFNYNGHKIQHEKEKHYHGKAGYQLLPQDFDLKYSENKNSYPSVMVNHEVPYKYETNGENNNEYNNYLKANNDNNFYNRAEKQEQQENEQYYKKVAEENYKNGPKSKPHQQRPIFVEDNRSYQHFVEESRRPSSEVTDENGDRQRTLDELLEKSRALTEQIQKLKVRTERELSGSLVRRGRHPYRWFRQ